MDIMNMNIMQLIRLGMRYGLIGFGAIVSPFLIFVVLAGFMAMAGAIIDHKENL